MRRETREVRESDATVFRDPDGDEVWIYWADGRCALGVASGENQDEPGKAVTLDAATLAQVMAELSSRLAALIEVERGGNPALALAARAALPRMAEAEKDPPPKRPEEMTREEIRTELGDDLRKWGMSVSDAVQTLDALERGSSLAGNGFSARTCELARALGERAQKAGPA